MANIIRAQITIRDRELISIPFSELKKESKRKLLTLLVEKMIEEDLIKIEESPDFESNSKTISAEMVAISREEYSRLINNESVASGNRHPFIYFK